MSKSKAETRKLRLTIFFIGTFVVAFLSAAIFLFMTAYDNKEKLVTVPIQGAGEPVSSKTSSEKWH